MRIAVVLENEVATGGGFNQAINAIRQIERIAPQYCALVVVRHAASLETLRPLIRTELVRYRARLGDYAMAAWTRLDATGELQARARFVGSFERFLIRRGIDAVYFVTPTGTALTIQRLSMITTVWDMCHRDAPEFPEVRASGEFRWRDHLLRRSLPQSVTVLTDSDISSARITARYGVDAARLIAMPFDSATHLSSPEEGPDVGESHGLSPGYIYYPAQFWPHKNHVRLIEALRILKGRGLERRLVFSGGDKGMLENVKAHARAHGVDSLVDFIGFADPEAMPGLYRGAAVVAMPSYFGPTNLPPLEAWTMRRPIVCSDVMRDQVGDAALTFDPDDANALAEALTEALRAETAEKLVANGLRRLAEIEEARRVAEARFVGVLTSLARRRRCWSPPEAAATHGSPNVH